MVSGRVTRRGGNHNGVLQGTGVRQILNHLSHIRALLAHGHVNAVHGAEAFDALVLFVDAGVIDDRVNRHGRLAGLAVANDQLTLAAPNRDHCVHRHDARLQRLIHRLAAHDTGRDFLHRIIRLRPQITLVINRSAQRVNHAAEQRFAHRHRQQLAGRAHLLALGDARVITKDHRAHLGLFEVQRQAGHAVAEIQHLVHHRAGQAFDLGHTVTDLAHHTHVFACHIGLGSSDLGFNVLQ